MTYYNVHNHGASLQLNGLVKVLEREFKIEAKALQFDRNFDYLDRSLKNKYVLSIKSIGIYFKYLKERGLREFLFNVKKKAIFEKFNKREDLIGDYYFESPQLDGIIIGSDEVFSIEIGLTHALFGHALPSFKVFSYAGCFGTTSINIIKKKHCEALISSGLKSMKGMSMRDQNSIFIAETLTGIKPELVVDPVILYGYENEIRDLQRPNLPKYILIYAYENRFNDPNEIKSVRDYAKKNGLVVVSPGFYHGWADYKINTDPIELLRYFKYAECVITDTFHGCVMSIITGTDMGVVIRDNANKLLNLMAEYELLDRQLDQRMKLDEVFSKKVDWNKTNSQIITRRATSMNYLRNMINN